MFQIKNRLPGIFGKRSKDNLMNDILLEIVIMIVGYDDYNNFIMIYCSIKYAK